MPRKTLARPTWAGCEGVRANADTLIHLAYLGTRPGARRSFCGYSAAQLREPTPREYRDASGVCPTCFERCTNG
jgi:hypothetical protein